jgi:N-acetyl-gamma-glutamyl-phosphate reductase
MHTVVHAGSPSSPRSSSATTRVAIAGATGYVGQELLRLLARHPAVTVTAAMSSGATATGRRLPALAHLWDGAITPLAPDTLVQEANVVFLALPDSAAASLAPTLVDAGVRVIDMSGAFRLRDLAARGRWYPDTQRVPGDVAYGLTERERDAIRLARLVANPGCYPTAALLALQPLTAAGLLLPGADVVIDAKSGISGAGKSPSERTHFSECHGNVAAYGLFNHRHGAEIEQEVGREVTFTPHLVPLDRGILSTIYLRLAPGTTEEAVGDAYEQAYAGATFVRLVGASLPEIKHVVQTNFCDIGWRVDASGRAIVVSVIDNLLKGASGQAVQNLNVMLDLDERTGLL